MLIEAASHTDGKASLHFTEGEIGGLSAKVL